MTITEMASTQSKIISLQSEIIDGLYTLLCQHLSADYLEYIPEVSKMVVAAGLRQKLGEE